MSMSKSNVTRAFLNERTVFRAPKPDEAWFVAEVDGRQAGCAYLVTLVDYFNERPHAHLSVLAVAADAEGQGVGSALLDRPLRFEAAPALGRRRTARRPAARAM